MRFPRLLLWLLPLLLSCTSPAVEPQPQPNVPAPIIPTGNGGTFLSLGDSYTIGEGVAETDRWSIQLAQVLRQGGAPVANPEILARTGWTTTDLQNAIVSAQNQRTYALVSLLIGVNDQYIGERATAYTPRFRQLLQTAIRFAGGRPERVFVLSIPDWGQSPYGLGRDRAQISAAIDEFNSAAQRECGQVGVAFIDITPLTRAAAGDETQFTPDRLHYSGTQMQKWAATAFPVVKGLLAK
ncbi:MAG TPA: GDSL-type esterase/lipase family protein [Hymenobacter sp.]|jgi:lysophospholipase L1-like esterase